MIGGLDRDVAAGRAAARAGGIRRGDAAGAQAANRSAHERRSGSMTSRREFLAARSPESDRRPSALSCRAQRPTPQQRGMMHDSSIVRDTIESVRDGPERGAPGALAAQAERRQAARRTTQRDALEHRIHCQCGCTLDVFTCRTTDFSCQVSPAMHRDVMALVDGGYSAQEIIDAFVGDVRRARADGADASRDSICSRGSRRESPCSSPARVHLLALLRRCGRIVADGAASGRPRQGVDATADELARLEAAVRRRRRTVIARSSSERCSPSARWRSCSIRCSSASDAAPASVVGACARSSTSDERGGGRAARDRVRSRDGQAVGRRLRGAQGALHRASRSPRCAAKTRRRTSRTRASDRRRDRGGCARVPRRRWPAARRAVRAPKPTRSICSNCGRYLRDRCAACGAPVVALEARYCTNCGNRLAA